jgi:hypothetical protein
LTTTNDGIKSDEEIIFESRRVESRLDVIPHHKEL